MIDTSTERFSVGEYLENRLNFDKESEGQTQSSWTYQAHTDDFGVAIRSLLVAKDKIFDNGVVITVFLKNFEEIGQKEGFEVYATTTFYYPRDSRVRTPKGHILKSTDANPKILLTALERLIKRENYLKNQSSTFATEHPSFKNRMQGSAIASKLHFRASEGYSPDSRKDYFDVMMGPKLVSTNIHTLIKPTRSYWEGGNVFVLTNTEGKTKVLISGHSLTVTHMVLRQYQYFQLPEKENTLAHIEETQSAFASLQDRVNTLYLNRQIPALVRQLAGELSEEAVIQTGYEMNAMGLIKAFSTKTSADKARLTDIVKDYVGQREFVKQVLWPSEFEVQAEDIVIVPNAHYHLDTFMKPGPKGSILLQDFDQTIQVLYKIEAHADDYVLTSEDRFILKNYIQEAKQLAKDLGPIYANIHEQCKRAKIAIIPIAGTFFGCNSRKERKNLNFLNALSGYSTLNQRFYYITSGASVGDRLGKVLMDEFRSTLEQLASPIQVYYIGNYSGTENYEQAMALTNLPDSQSGPHCLTVELATDRTVYKESLFKIEE
ncbi:hypothetical protein [Candidatus Protochlamydia phocaeensis]|uniref:hypothetical protein n=1 Tax=Candidatus Protochlamydia phocaeensis TaxID=1414722 RepID=UPI0008391BBA|nr:hypothetical protein [Candidatus Protochlamydia phocaeensis]